MTEKQKKQLYESIMKSVAKTVKKTLNEFNVFGVEVTSFFFWFFSFLNVDLFKEYI